MTINRHLAFWGTLILLVLGTIVIWQLRYQETGKVFWRDGEVTKLAGWKTPARYDQPEVQEDFLSFPTSPEGQRSAIVRSWPVNGGESIKVRVKHRAPKGLIEPVDANGHIRYPYLVQCAGFNAEGQAFSTIPQYIAMVTPDQEWGVVEGVVQIPDDARRISLGILAMAKGGTYELASLDVVEVTNRWWVKTSFVILTIFWSIWLMWGIRRQRGEGSWTKVTSLLATIWILGWGAFLVFPRTVDLPRPFLSQFNVSPSDESQLVAALEPTKPKLQDQSAIDSSKRKQSSLADEAGVRQKIALFFKGFAGGRFLLHIGIMGLFAGGLMLLISARECWPYIAAIAVGVELVPWIWLGNFEKSDGMDLAAYGVAFAIALPIAGRLRRR